MPWGWQHPGLLPVLPIHCPRWLFQLPAPSQSPEIV